MRKFVAVFVLVLILAACVRFPDNDTLSLQPGLWRAVLERQDGIRIPFQFEVADTDGRRVLRIRNGAGRLVIDSFRYRGDTVFIHMPFFEADFRARFQNDGSLRGVWIKHYPDSDRTLAFSAFPDTRYRIMAHPRPPSVDLSGRWAVVFSGDGDSGRAAVGEFRQQDSYLTGTFLNRSGDYRYLEGVMNGDTLMLSAFDGSNIFLFRALAENDSVLRDGVFYSGFSGHTRWQARKDSDVRLADPFSVTTYKPGEDRLSFRFPDLKGDTLSLADEQFTGKVVIVQIMGSWCPNCMDETAFLSPWYERNKDRGVAVIGLCYERSPDFGEAVKSVLPFKRRFHINYPLVITGVKPGDPELLAKTLPQLNHFVGFPTTIFLNRNGDIARIHAGFSGPGTGAHYQAFIREFNQLMDSLLAE